MSLRKDIEQLIQETSEKLYNLGYSDGVYNTFKEFQPEIKRSYNDGLKDAWDCAKKIACMDWEDDTKLFGCENPFEAYSASEVMDMIETYEMEKGSKFTLKEKKPEDDDIEKQEEDIDKAFKELKKKKEEEKSCKNCNTTCTFTREFFRDIDGHCSDWTPKQTICDDCSKESDQEDEGMILKVYIPKRGQKLTNGDVIKAMFGSDKIFSFTHNVHLKAKVDNWFNECVVAEFDKEWWNAPYEREDGEVDERETES